jgi:hypothetical protein
LAQRCCRRRRGRRPARLTNSSSRTSSIIVTTSHGWRGSISRRGVAHSRPCCRSMAAPGTTRIALTARTRRSILPPPASWCCRLVSATHRKRPTRRHCKTSITAFAGLKAMRPSSAAAPARSAPTARRAAAIKFFSRRSAQTIRATARCRFPTRPTWMPNSPSWCQAGACCFRSSVTSSPRPRATRRSPRATTSSSAAKPRRSKRRRL